MVRFHERRPGVLLPALVLSITGAVSAGAAVVPNASGPVLVVGPDGLGLFAYYDRTNADLKVAHCVDAACTAVTTVTVDSAGDVGRKASMVMAPAGPVIAYEDTTNGTLKLALCADALCASAATVAIAPDLVGANTAIALAASGRPLLVYVARSATLPHRLKAAHCEDAGCLTTTISDLAGGAETHEVGLVVGGDGRGLITFARVPTIGLPTPGALIHCADVACTSASLADGVPWEASAPDALLLGPALDHPSMQVGADGFIRVAIAYSYFEGSSIKLRRCLDAACGASNVATIPARFGPPSLALAPGDVPRMVLPADQLPPQIDIAHCADADCSALQSRSCLASMGRRPSLALDSGSAPLVAFEIDPDVHVVRPPVTCNPMITIENATVTEQTAPATSSLSFKVSLLSPGPAPSVIGYSTAAGSAQSGIDFLPVSGTLTFVPGQPTDQFVEVPVVPDTIDEPEETLELVLSAPVNALVADDRAVGTILDDDSWTTRLYLRGDCAVVEGDAGPRQCAVEAFLTEPSLLEVRVDYYTFAQSATAGLDYQATEGTLTYPPGTVSRTLSVSILGDVAVESDETFILGLINVLNAGAGDFQSTITIVDDDAPSHSRLEVAHGSVLTADLAPDPGPVPDQDLYRVSQAPFSSYEAVLDGVSGDAVPGARLERVAPDGSAVLQVASAVGTGSAMHMRFVNRLAAPVDNQYIRVGSASCGTGCGPDDTYRLRVYETTGTISRFNNAGGQATVLIMQNTTDRQVDGYVDFWSTGGTWLRSIPFWLPPRWTWVMDTTPAPELMGIGGSVTVTHDGPYGAVAGKAVALEPSTGFSFDSPMTPKPR